VLLLLGAALVAVLSFLLWHTLQLEAHARGVERERAELLAERVLRTAATSPAVFACVPAQQRLVLRSQGELDDSVGWLDLLSNPPTDLVVEDRLARAARAEFGSHDMAAASREFAELERQPLPSEQRIEVLAAAAWHHTRAGDAEQVPALLRELDERIDKLDRSRLANPNLANAVAAALRLQRGSSPAWADRLVPFLPELAHAGLPVDLQRADAAAAVRARRELLQAATREWRALGDAARDGLFAVGGEELLWSLPRDDGAHDAARLSIGEWLAVVKGAGRSGVVPEWPWLVEAQLGTASDTFAGVPRLRGLAPASGPSLGERSWLLPAITAVLLLAFGLAARLQFRAAAREAAAVRAHAEFLTTVTHELRTPLASIRLLGEMLAEGRAAGREVEYYKMLASEAGRLSVLIENVLDLGRLERGERAYDLRPVSVREVIGETMSLFAPVGERDGMRVSWLDRLEAEVKARLDRGAFVQALVCVLDNSRKYGVGRGGIDVVTRFDAGRVVVEVRDYGPGVPEHERERIFERFVRGAAHAHGGTPGIGIGLYLARTIARRLGGDLVCGSPADGGPGACFTFSFAMETPS